MKIILNIVDARFQSGSKEKLASELAAAVSQTAERFGSLRYWGKYGQKKKSLKKIPDLQEVLQSSKPGMYSLSDKEAGEGGEELQLSLRRELISLQLFREFDPEDLSRECETLKEHFRLLYTGLKSVTFPLTSSITLPEIDFARPRPPKRWRVFDPWGIVDFIKPSGIDFPDAEAITHKLADGALPKGVRREAIDRDMIVVDWTGMQLEEEGIANLLSRRSVWYHENSQFERDPSFNDQGDARVDIFDNRETSQLTFYDSVTETGYKAIGFDAGSNSYEEDKVKKLRNMLKKQETAEGLPLSKAFIVVSKRKFALHLKPAIDQQGVSGVLYADDAGQLWNPFPEGLWLPPLHQQER